MANYDSNYAIAQEISARIGNSPIPFDSVYSICLEIYRQLGGEESGFDSVYSILLEILPLVEGGGGKAIEDVSVLPDAEENKNKFYRLTSDDNIYVSECTSEGSEGNPGLGFAALQYFNSDEDTTIVCKRYPEGDLIQDNYFAWARVNNSEGKSISEITDWTINTGALTFTSSETPAIGSTTTNDDDITDYSPNVGYEPTIPATWAWEKVATQEYVDNVVKPAIIEVSELPNAEENKDKLFRLDNGDKDVYAAKLLSSETITTNRLPDEQQIDKAYIYTIEDEPSYYKGAYHIICSDGEIDGYMWYQHFEDDTDYFILTNKSAEVITNTDNMSDFNEVINGRIDEGTRTIDLGETSIDNLFVVGLGNSSVVIPATYNAPESAQIGNATLYAVNIIDDLCTYTGIQETVTLENQESFTGYKWDYGDSDYYVLTDKPASEIYAFVDTENFIVYSDLKIVAVSEGVVNSQDEYLSELYTPQLNAPDSEQVGVAKIYDTINNAYYVCTESTTIYCSDGVEVPAYLWVAENPHAVEWSKILSNAPSTCYSSIPTGVMCDEDFYYDSENERWATSYDDMDSSSVAMMLNDAISYRYGSDGQFEYSDLVKYQRTETTEEWGWEKVATEGDVNNLSDEITNLSDELTTKANKVDFVIPVDMMTQSLSWSALDGATTTGMYHCVARVDYMGVQMDMGCYYLSVVNMTNGGILQTLFKLDNGTVAQYGQTQVALYSRSSNDTGSTWTNMTELYLPSIEDYSVTSAQALVTVYSRSKVDSLIAALDARITALENPNA